MDKNCDNCRFDGQEEGDLDFKEDSCKLGIIVPATCCDFECKRWKPKRKRKTVHNCQSLETSVCRPSTEGGSE